MTIDLDAIEARARAATEGPWTVNEDGHGVEARADDDFGGIQIVPWIKCENAAFIAHAYQDIPALIAELRHLRASSLPARVTLPTGTVAEVVSVQARYTLPTGGSWHESMSLATWRRQGNVREELRDGSKGPV